MVINSTNVNKTNNLSPQIIDKKRPRHMALDIHAWLDVAELDWLTGSQPSHLDSLISN
jgi:hypothetical protein